MWSQQAMARGPNQPDIYFCKFSFTGTQPCSFIYLLFMAAFTLQHSWLVAAKTMWSRKALLPVPLQSMFADSWSRAQYMLWIHKIDKVPSLPLKGLQSTTCFYSNPFELKFYSPKESSFKVEVSPTRGVVMLQLRRLLTESLACRTSMHAWNRSMKANVRRLIWSFTV